MTKIILIYLAVLALLFTFPTSILAHPGRTASDGCHYCRTNCDEWGVPWNERHCHGGGSIPAEPNPAAPALKPASTQKPYVAPLVPVSEPTRKPTSKPVVIPTPIQKCSAVSDGICPSNCTAGNDNDCCSNRSDYKWYENWGCYPKELLCSAQADGICHWYCSAGNDADCCDQKLSDYHWFENWGCYPKSMASCSAESDGICPTECSAGNDVDCCTQNLEGYNWYENWGCYPE